MVLLIGCTYKCFIYVHKYDTSYRQSHPYYHMYVDYELHFESVGRSVYFSCLVPIFSLQNLNKQANMRFHFQVKANIYITNLKRKKYLKGAHNSTLLVALFLK